MKSQFLFFKGSLFCYLPFIANLIDIGTGSIIGFKLYGPIMWLGFTFVGF